MSEIDTKCMELFPDWLKNLGDDVKIVADCMNGPLDRHVKSILTGGINYLFKSLDLIPDGIDDIGYLDDAFVLRISARNACDTGIESLSDDQKIALGRLADQTSIIRELLGQDIYDRLARYTDNLTDGSARGRSVQEILDDETVAREFAEDIEQFISTYETPDFAQDEKNLIRLKSFMEAKLPA